MLKIMSLTITPFFQNARIVADTDTGVATVVDPGGEVNRILEVLKNENLRCTQVWLTHSHIDHCGGVSEMLRQTGAKLFAHKADCELRQTIDTEAAYFGLADEELANCPEPTQYLDEGDAVSVGNYSFIVFHTPGHSPGHVAFYCESESLIISGDSIFKDAIGRVDLPGGSAEQLLHSVQMKILKLPRHTNILCGHGPDTTVGAEIESNPYFSYQPLLTGGPSNAA